MTLQNYRDLSVSGNDFNAGFQFEFSAEAVRNHFGDLDTAPANACYCGSYCKFVHNGKYAL